MQPRITAITLTPTSTPSVSLPATITVRVQYNSIHNSGTSGAHSDYSDCWCGNSHSDCDINHKMEKK